LPPCRLFNQHSYVVRPCVGCIKTVMPFHSHTAESRVTTRRAQFHVTVSTVSGSETLHASVAQTGTTRKTVETVGELERLAFSPGSLPCVNQSRSHFLIAPQSASA